MGKIRFLLLILILGCVGQDIELDEVDPEVQFENPILNLQIGDFFQLEYKFLDNVGMEATPSLVTWNSSDESVATVDDTGLLMGISDGTVTIEAYAEKDDLEATSSITFTVSTSPTTLLDEGRSGVVATTSSYLLTGDFTLRVEANGLSLDLADNYQADTGLPGLYVYLSNNPNTIAGAFEIGAVTTFSGAHSYFIDNVGLFDYNYVLYYCKPFNVKVGHGDIE